VRVFLHVAAMNHYREVVAELAGMITGSGLYDEASLLVCSIVGEGDVDGLLGERWNVVRSGGLEEYEYPTLDLLHAQARIMPSEHFLYLHSKGVSRPRHRAHQDAWRRYMTHCVIERWEECVHYLERGYTCVGNDWHEWKHFAGNFWWARGDYIASLCDPREMIPKGSKGPRYGAELWIGSGKVHPLELTAIPRIHLHQKYPIPENAYRSSS
jgi:hypothetical protein